MEYPFSGFIPYDPTTDPITLPGKRFCPNKYLDKVEAAFLLPEGTMSKRHKVSDKPFRKWGNVNLSEVRKAAIYHLKLNSNLGPNKIGEVFRLDHSAVIIAGRSAEAHFLADDKTFLDYYRIVKQIAV